MSNPTDKIHLELELGDANLILEALGQLPFARVYALINRIQEQARTQLQPPVGGDKNT